MHNMIFGANSEVDRIKESKMTRINEARPNYEKETKIEIINQLLGINGSMKEFSEEIEQRMNKAFKSKAGKKFGLSEVEIEMRKLKGSGNEGFTRVRENARDVEKMAKQYLSSQSQASINPKFLKKAML